MTPQFASYHSSFIRGTTFAKRACSIYNMIYRNRILFLVSLIVSLSIQTYANDNEIDLNKIDLDKIKEKLPFEVPPSLQNVTLPSIDEVKKIIKDKCSKVSGGDDAYATIERGAEDLKNCTTGLIDYEVLQKEIEEAEPSGELDTVFNKYCRKRDIAIGCMENFTNILEPCLEPKEIEGKRTFVKIFKNLLNFVCYKDGDQIALFIAEKGPECFNDRKDDLISCMNATFHGYLPSEKEIQDRTVPTELPQLVMGATQCNDMDTLQRCVVKSLEKCEESTPANLVESMFKFVRNETPCGNLTAPKADATKKNDAYTSTFSSTLIASIFALVFVRSFVA